jgi:hypothetical protein
MAEAMQSEGYDFAKLDTELQEALQDAVQRSVTNTLNSMSTESLAYLLIDRTDACAVIIGKAKGGLDCFITRKIPGEIDRKSGGIFSHIRDYLELDAYEQGEDHVH